MRQIYKVDITDLERKGYVMIKHDKDKSFRLVDDLTYILDNVKLVINKKGEVVLCSTSQTIIR